MHQKVNSNQVNWMSLFAQKGTEETVRVSNNYRKKHLAKLVMAYNSGMATFTRDISLRIAKYLV